MNAMLPRFRWSVGSPGSVEPPLEVDEGTIEHEAGLVKSSAFRVGGNGYYLIPTVSRIGRR
jgi:hypothetical protein